MVEAEERAEKEREEEERLNAEVGEGDGHETVTSDGG